MKERRKKNKEGYLEEQLEVATYSIGSLRSYDGNCNENVTLEWNFALSCLLRLFHVGRLVQNRRSAHLLAWHEWFSCKGKERKLYCCELALSSKLQT